VLIFLKKACVDYGVVMGGKEEEEILGQDVVDKSARCVFSLAFFPVELGRVVQPLSIMTADEYKTASRIGRGTRLNRQQRVDIWPVFERYRHLLASNYLKETDDAYRDARRLLENNPELRP